MRTRRRMAATQAACLLFAAIPTQLHAESDYPSHPIKFIVPFPPGGGNDNVARPIASEVAELIGQSIFIENKPGAGTMIGAEAAARSAPDGYTLFLGSIGSHAVSPSLYKKVPYDPVKDFEPVALLYNTGSWYGVLVPARTPAAVVARLNQEFRKALQDPVTAQRLRTLGADPVGDSREEFAAFIKSELAKYGKVIKDNAITAE